MAVPRVVLLSLVVLVSLLVLFLGMQRVVTVMRAVSVMCVVDGTNVMLVQAPVLISLSLAQGAYTSAQRHELTRTL